METPRSPNSVASPLDRPSGHQQQQNQQGNGNNVLFPWKLHEMLRTCVSEGKENIVSWLPDGDAFKVHNVPEFVGNILPSFFKQTKYKSFQRQLNLWGFERLTSGPDKGAYYHKQFLRDDPSLCRHLTRQRARKPSSAAAAVAKAPSVSPKPKAAVRPARPVIVQAAVPPPVPPAIPEELDVGDSLLSGATLPMPRQVSETSFGELLHEIDGTHLTAASALDLAEFEGFTFHLLEHERYEELNLEFKFTPSVPDSQTQLDQTAQSLLQELEQGTFGTPKTNFEASSSELCAV
mmetsp:Transcript_27655/g.45738  ORF Transcript_27655/g.45738 Transcript_27655/m.45738 type:complete len:292 (-) Transcript_27655:111-986(-)